MSDTMSLEMRVTAHDDASPVIRKIMADVRRLQATIRKSFENPAGKLDLGLDSIKSAAANQRTESHRTAVTVMRDLNRVSAFQGRMRRQAARENEEARRADAVGQADAIRDLRDRMRFGSRLAAQKLREQKDVSRERDREVAETRRNEAAAQAEALRSLRERMSFASRMTRQRVSEERAAARDIAQAERERAREVRDNARLDARRTRERDRADRSREREHERDRNDFTGRARDAGHRVSDAYTRSTRMAAGVGVAGAVGTGALIKRSLGAETSVDDAEIATRQYGGLSKSQARDLRDKWAAPLSEELGVETSKLLGAWVDATKLGIPASGAKDFAKLTTKTSEAWEVGFDKVKDTLGTVNSILTSDGSAFDIKRLSSVSNTLQHLAAKQSTTPEKLIEFLSQGAGASQILGASQEAGLAFGSASTSLGNKAGESGRLYDYIASRIVEMPRLTKKKGDDGKYSKQLMQDLGYGTAENMDSIRRSNPDAFLPDFMDRFSKIKDPKKQEEAIRWFSGREWMGEFGRMVKGAETYREAEKLRQEAKGLDAIGEVWETHKEKLSFVFKQFKAGWLNILGEFGKELSPLARQAGDFFLGWTKELRSGGLAARFKAALQGAIEGLGFKDLPAMLSGMFGKPGEGGAGSVEAWKSAAFGFADGIRSVGAAIKQVFSTFAGANASPETIARLTGQIIALAGACVVLAPVVGVIGSLATALGALALAATSAWRVIGGAGLAGGAAAGAGAARAGASATAGAAAGGIASRLGLAGAGTALLSGIGLAIVAEIGANRGTIATSVLTAIKEFVTGLVPIIVTGIKDAVSAIVADIKSKFTLENLKNELTPAPLKRWMDGPAKEQPNQAAPPSAGSPARAYASGGYVSGPGGPRSDSISAFLSNGEFVMNADVVRKIRPWLEDLNAGRIPKDFLHGQSALGDWSGFDKLLTSSGFRGQALSGIRFDPSTALSGNGIFGDGRNQIGELIREIRELIRVLRGERRGAGGRAEEGRATIRERVRISEAARLAEQAGARTRLLALSGGVGPIISGVPAGSGSSVGGGGSGAPRDNSGVGGILNARPGQRLGTGSLGRRGIIGGTGGEGSVPALPGNVSMTPEERNTLGLIMKYESGGQNVMNYVGRSRGLDATTAKGYTAQGYFQMLNSNWRRIAPKLGITTPNAMASSLEDQTRVALHLLRNGGIGNWANYNPKLRAALARGEQASAGSVPNVGGITGGAGQYDGLRLKGAQATAGGAAHRGVTDLMRAVQGDLPGAVKHFAAVNDKYHLGTRSKHAAGLAFDTSLVDPSKSREAAEAIRNRLRAAGLKEGEFRVIDEYLNPSRRSTGGHIHTQFNTAEAAQKYASYLEGLKGPAVAAAEATKDAARAATGAGALSNLPQVGKLVDRMGSDKARELIGQGLLSEGFRKHRLDGALGGRGDLMQNLPFRSSPEDLSGAVRDQVEAKGKAQGATIQGGTGGKSMTVQAPITIQGSTNPEHVANRAAKHIQDSTLWRTHDQDFASV